MPEKPAPMMMMRGGEGSARRGLLECDCATANLLSQRGVGQASVVTECPVTGVVVDARFDATMRATRH